MPKGTAYHLAWSPARCVYELSEHPSKQVLPVIPGSDEWFAWVATVPSFAFHSQAGQLTVRQESRPRGSTYWYASRRIGGKMTKRYLGRTGELTIARLEEIVTLLSQAQTSFSQELEDETGKNGFSHRAGAEALGRAVDTPTIPHPKAHTHRDPLLATKLYLPRPRAQLVPRSRLIERLQQGMEHALTLISAPAGFGKTTLLVQWLAESNMPSAWLSLDSEENEPRRFFSYLLAALRTLCPPLGSVVQALLEAPQDISMERVLTFLVNDILKQATGTFALVLDDYHVIENAAIHRGMSFLLEHVPPQMHVVIATRVDPSFPLVRLRARNQLTEIRTADLRFTADEADIFLRTLMGIDLPPPAFTALEHRTEGWIAGLQFAALSLQGRSDVSAFLHAFTGSHRFVLDYLTEEVFSRQPAGVQSFLLSTSILERLSGPLCDAVTGQTESQARLASLDEANLFLVPLDDERHWYRYHHLFAEVLLTRLQQTDPSSVLQLHLRASRWYEQQGLLTEAVQHALAASDVERAADLLESIDIGSWAGHGEQIHWMLHWLERLPDALVRARPMLSIIHAVALMFTNQFQEAEARLQAAEHCLDVEMPPEQARFIWAHVAAIRGNIARYRGDLARSVALSQEALAFLPEEEVTPRPIARVNAAHSFLVSGDVTAQQERFTQEMVGSQRASANLSMIMRSFTTMARFQITQGRLRQAAKTFEEAARAVPRQEDLRTTVGSPAYYFGLADILREWNEMSMAEPLLEQGMELVNGGFTVDAEVVTLGYITLARLQIVRLEYSQALTTLDTLTHLAHAHSFAPHLIARALAWRAHIELAQGNLKAALSWVEQCGLSGSDDRLSYQREREYLTLARVRIAQGDDPSAFFFQGVSQLLDRLLQDAEAKARGSSILELLLLQALALAAQDEQDAALSPLERALSLAEPEGYVRLFVDEGASMRALLRQALARGITPRYVSTLLTAFGEPAETTEAHPPSPADLLVEPLTKREREVLQLLAEGASNREIAQRLILSTGTVKKYVYNICGKLGVQSRMQALVRARALHLL
jgi:LuxR family maltose regulon positive regulatory protein